MLNYWLQVLNRKSADRIFLAAVDCVSHITISIRNVDLSHAG
jgi:hypothetical protein